MTIILFIATVITFLTIDYFHRRNEEHQIITAPTPVRVSTTPLRAPGGIFFAKSHTWLALFPSGKIKLGVDDFVLRMLHTPAIQLLKTPGSHVAKGDPIFLLKDGAKELTVRSPLEGTIDNRNDEIALHPEALTSANGKLFSNGWAYTITPQRVSDLRQLLIGDETQTWIREELSRLRDFFAGAYAKTSLAPAFLQDGGTPVNGALAELNDEQWKKFEQEFLITL